MEKKKRILSKVLIAILVLLIGVVAGAGGFYLISLAPRTNLEEKIAAKDTVITELNGQLDSLKAALEYVEEETKGNEKILSVLIDTT
ncbi:hypothetical protein GF338_04255, partial [candidate division WOR-3 bacterium]|nr:hypothetical protein [candidate division WOR-3 bacterium]